MVSSPCCTVAFKIVWGQSNSLVVFMWCIITIIRCLKYNTYRLFRVMLSPHPLSIKVSSYFLPSMIRVIKDLIPWYHNSVMTSTIISLKLMGMSIINMLLCSVVMCWLLTIALRFVLSFYTVIWAAQTNSRYANILPRLQMRSFSVAYWLWLMNLVKFTMRSCSDKSTLSIHDCTHMNVALPWKIWADTAPYHFYRHYGWQNFF